MSKRIDLSATSKLRVYVLTAIGTVVCIVAAFVIDSYSFVNGWQVGERWLNNVIIPLVLAPPFFFFLLSKLRELSLAHRELMQVASTDSLTNCLNRRAFSALVDRYLDRIENSREKGRGALLVVDIDHFKRVNDRFGHDIGDEALKLVADTIKASVRELDLVARLGGEEFGVFLPDLDPRKTTPAAERIRCAVRDADFSPDGSRHALTISVGGVSFVPPTSFSQLYRSADQCLYAAKRGGRDRVEIAGPDAPPGRLVAMVQ